MDIGIVGCGKMISAVCEAINDHSDSLNFKTYSKTFNSAKELASKLDGQACEQLNELDNVDYLFLGCKPQQFLEVSNAIKKQLNLNNTVIVSILAGTSTESISKELQSQKVIRLMPSMPIKESMGISLFYFSSAFNQEQKSEFISLFKNCSSNFMLETQKQFDQITTISSSGAAYVYFFTSIFADKLKDFGLSELDAKNMAIQLFLGSSKLMSVSSDSLQSMIDSVTSKKGVTIEAIDTFKSLNLEDLVNSGIDNAYKRSRQLSEMI